MLLFSGADQLGKGDMNGTPSCLGMRIGGSHLIIFLLGRSAGGTNSIF